MKIGIFTLPLNENYGGILQAFALQKYIRNRGHEVFHIEEKVKKSVIYKASFVVKLWYFSKLVLNFGNDPEGQIRQVYLLNKRARKLRNFVKKYIKINYYEHLTDYKSDRFGALVVGSDQIWKPQYYPNIQHAFLDFTQNDSIKRIAYAPSLGTDNWTFSSAQTHDCKLLLQHFDAISVREDNAVEMLKKYLDSNALQIIDPTMLLSKEDYKNLLPEKVQDKPNQLTTYILDDSEEKLNFLDNIVRQEKLSHFVLNFSSDADHKAIEDWLRGFLEASFIVTDSFHGCVFSILFEKPFIALVNKNRGEGRFTSLLKLFDLEYRLMYNLADYKSIYKQPIDWNKIRTILNRERIKADTFFKNQQI